MKLQKKNILGNKHQSKFKKNQQQKKKKKKKKRTEPKAIDMS